MSHMILMKPTFVLFAVMLRLLSRPAPAGTGRLGKVARGGSSQKGAQSFTYTPKMHGF